MFLNIQRDAIFVADAHFNEKRLEFQLFLKKVEEGKIKTTQLFLMGDIFDFLCLEVDYFIKRNQELINTLNSIAKDIEIIYLEGNHDFNIKSLFPDILIINRENQPLDATYEKKSVKIAHGDIFTPWHYNLYCKVIRNHFFLKFLNLIDFKHLLSKKVYYTLIDKKICHKMKDFESFVKSRVKNYSSDVIIEGHFHQGDYLEYDKKLYVNIPSLCCDKKYFRLKDNFVGESL